MSPMPNRESQSDHEKFGSQTRWEVVRVDDSDNREWLETAPICKLLENHHIAHVGRMWARRPFEVIRAEASGTFALVVLEGEGETRIDGGWRKVTAGDICLLPAFARTGIRATTGSIWQFAWVRYEEAREQAPILTSNSPVVHRGEVTALDHAIAGLNAESSRSAPETAAQHHWIELIHGFVKRAASSYQTDDRLWRVWDAVARDLPRQWTLADMARLAFLSSEHLRRLSKQQLGRSPMQQVTHLRMRHAAEVLATTDEKVETIARDVGYENPFTFSNAFKRWTGRRPSEYRGR